MVVRLGNWLSSMIHQNSYSLDFAGTPTIINHFPRPNADIVNFQALLTFSVLSRC